MTCPLRSDRVTRLPARAGRANSWGASPSSGTICMSKRRPSTSAATAAPAERRSAAASAAAVLRTEVDVALLLELHDAHHPALRQMMGPGGVVRIMELEEQGY